MYIPWVGRAPRDVTLVDAAGSVDWSADVLSDEADCSDDDDDDDEVIVGCDAEVRHPLHSKTSTIKQSTFITLTV